LGIRETGVIDGVFHALTEAALKMSRQNPSLLSTYPFTILSHHTIAPVNAAAKLQNWIIQTGSNTGPT
jgi:hypothetical protein